MGRILEKLKNLAEGIMSPEDLKNSMDHGDELVELLTSLPTYSSGLGFMAIYPDPEDEFYNQLRKSYPVDNSLNHQKGSHWEVGRVGQGIFIAKRTDKPVDWMYLTQRRV